MRFMTDNWLFMLLVGLAAGIYLVFIFPYIRDSGHGVLSFGVFAIFAILFVYGRAMPPTGRSSKRPR